MDIRLTDLKNANDLEILSRESHKEFKYWTYENKKSFRKILKKKNEGIYIAKIGNKIVGYLHFEYIKEKRRLWIEQIYVLREFRKNNVAKNLIIKLIKKWRKIKFINIVLLTADRNVKIFEKLRFRKTMNYMEYVLTKKR